MALFPRKCYISGTNGGGGLKLGGGVAFCIWTLYTRYQPPTPPGSKVGTLMTINSAVAYRQNGRFEGKGPFMTINSAVAYRRIGPQEGSRLLNGWS